MMKTPVEIITKLFIATDQRDWQAIAETMDENIFLDYSSMTGNPPATFSPGQIIAAWKNVLPGFESTHHQLGNFRSTVADGIASVSCYGIALHYLPDVAGNLWTVAGTYDFNLRQDTANEWRITAMKFNFRFQDGNTILPEKAGQRAKSEQE